MDELFNTDELAAVLQEYGVAVRNLYQDRLILHDRIASGELLNSVDNVRVEVEGTTYEVKLDLAKYWRYVEMDTEPHWPPKGALLEWIHWKISMPRPMKNGKLPTPEQLDYLIRRKIAVFGTKGHPDLTDSVEDMNKAYQARIADALARATGSYIRKLVRDA
jgi:hypothetical protein